MAVIKTRASGHADYVRGFTIGPAGITSADAAFDDGLHAALYVSAGLALASGRLAFITLRSRAGTA